MGLVIGVVQIEYQDYPGDVAHDFVQHLNQHVWERDHYAYDIEWSIGAEGHTFIELSRGTMQDQMKKFGTARGLSPDGMAEIQAWSDGLPWRNDLIMLHLNW